MSLDSGTFVPSTVEIPLPADKKGPVREVQQSTVKLHYRSCRADELLRIGSKCTIAVGNQCAVQGEQLS
jgi:hypothetical protein